MAATGSLSEPQFAALVDALSSDPSRRQELNELLREDHPVYDQRGAAATVRMRGWILMALARTGLTDTALLFVLEELDTGRDAYLVAAAARALRSYANPLATFAPFVMRAITNIRYHDELVAFDHYGQYAISSSGTTTPVRELLATLVWLGPRARAVLPEIEALLARGGGFSGKLRIKVERVVKTIADSAPVNEHGTDTCCASLASMGNALSWARGSRRDCETIESTVFQDHDGATLKFGEFFRGQPSVIVFFYTRCDNPQKCSLTIAKLARLQSLLRERGLAERIRTAAISYDPAFDLPDRLRGYGRSRGVCMNQNHRMLRTTNGFSALRRHFKLGVNFVESLVNRHRIEVYILDAAGAIAASFQRIHWQEHQIVDRAAELLDEQRPTTPIRFEPETLPLRHSSAALPVFGTLASFGFAFFPKCPFCWVAYMSLLGVTGLEQIPWTPWLQPFLVALMLLNLFSVWMRGQTTRRLGAFFLVAIGAIAIILSKSVPGLAHSGAWTGVALTLVGSLWSAAQRTRKSSPLFLRRLVTRP